MTDEQLAQLIKDAIKKETDSLEAGLLSDIIAETMRTAEKALLQNQLMIKDELLNINTHINERLDSLKGEKGDKGETGKRGLLSGVSFWKDGDIARQGDACSYQNGLWLCEKETGKAPQLCPEWLLISDGIKETKVDNGNLKVIKTSGVEVDLGRVSVSVAGAFVKGDSYSIYDIVTHNKTSWISLKDNNTNHPPSDSWVMLAGKGARGETGKKGEKGETGNSIDPEDLIPIVKTIVEAD